MERRTTGQIDWVSLPSAADLFGEMHLAELAPAPAPQRETVFHGLAVCVIAAAAAAWLSEHYHFPIILLGLLIGLSLSFVAKDPRSHMGLDFASRTCLRFGVVLLGLQVTFGQIGSLGPQPFAALLAIMTVTFLAGIAGAKLVGESRYTGILAGGATAICGASAAMALYGIIGRERLSQSQFAITLVVVSLASALAMSLYPILAEYLDLTDSQAGFLIGASIHDVAQAIGGGYAFSASAGSYATIVKLSRVALLAPVVILTGLAIGSAQSKGDDPIWKRLALPWFIVAFFAVVLANSMVQVPADLRDAALNGSKGLLLIAVIATAMRSRLDLLMETGLKPAIPVTIATLVSFVASLASAYLIS
ncbi:putative integral membrane protein (TIGR00698 family) [Novosphingobium taihuense]|uniref:Putative integral membrane protein (TIGR00698 family) n=2 Tax=Novosphingobium taihuense TaxID=260085 RepID=A0A7W7AD83_9SPHN|nr:putative sulfate exporter family transporter [Novosphingobium taihuense]MBB4614129.1 putative integral membrane protein (TIGR00698 family) [Novosphingobium taihuense]TWH86979.1 putative integral membrane protein (TIGR00698 family) [Novosphingobium taihuense]